MSHNSFCNHTLRSQTNLKFFSAPAGGQKGIPNENAFPPTTCGDILPNRYNRTPSKFYVVTWHYVQWFFAGQAIKLKRHGDSNEIRSAGVSPAVLRPGFPRSVSVLFEYLALP
jgi:hypothetical protein